MIIKTPVTIPELTQDKKRNLYVYLPKEYDAPENAGKNYPVLYMFDGHNVFFDEDATYGKSWGMKEYLEKLHLPLIVAAVECNHEGDHRLMEYSPWDFENERFGFIKGLGMIYMKWMTETLIPTIDSRYRTIPGRSGRGICGSSMGGLMSVYALAAYPDIFSRAAGLSPSLWANYHDLKHLIEQADIPADTWLYMDYGSTEGRQEDLLRALVWASEAFEKKNVSVCSRIIPGGFHSEASWEKQIPRFMRWLGWDHQGMSD